MNEINQDDTRRTIERVACESYGRLVAYLSVHTHDLASAEDALSNALVSALSHWPQNGVPQNPEAWLMTAARRSLIDVIRHQRVVLETEPTLKMLTENSTETDMSTQFPDERLKLLFVCAHPAIDPAMHTPLMLQTVLGLDAARIAQAFLIAPKTMGQRLFRAKTKIRSGGIPFETPQEHDLPQRLDAILEAIYATFGIGWDDMAGADQRGRDLAEEALWLARVLLQLMPGEAEVRGLLALMLYCEAHRPARRGSDGRYIPLSEQDPKQWSLALIEEAERHLAEAFKHGRSGRFQLEAAIQSVHAERACGGRVEWRAIVRFYEQLIRISPALGTRTAYAAALAEANGPEAGLAVLESIDAEAVSYYQPYWAVRAHLLQRLGKTREATDAVGQSRKNYVFDGPNRKVTLAELFDGKSQLIVYHLMFGPDWQEACPSCSFNMDHTDGALVHLAQRDASFAAVSRAPYPKIAAFKKRMGWRFNWVSSNANDFNRDYHVLFSKEELATGKVNHNFNLEAFPGTDAPGFSVFYKDQNGDLFHTYSAYARGTEVTMNTYNYLDLVPKGRDEDGLRFTMSWLRHHDRYESGQLADAAMPYWPGDAVRQDHRTGPSASRNRSARSKA